MLSAFEKETFLSKRFGKRRNPSRLSSGPPNAEMTEHSLLSVILIILLSLPKTILMLCTTLTSYGGKTKELFHWLLERADRQDLDAVKEIIQKFSGWAPEFQTAVEKALSKVSLNVRIGIRQRPAVIKREA